MVATMLKTEEYPLSHMPSIQKIHVSQDPAYNIMGALDQNLRLQ